MSFEMLKVLSQAYTDQQKRPHLLPRKIETMVQAYDDICSGEDPWTALGNFTNAWYGYAKHLRTDLIRDSLTRPEQETDETRRWGAFCAASVEYLCSLFHLPCPQWVHDPSYILPTPWWYTLRANDPKIRESLRKTTPPPFVCRNIFCGNRLYQNKYEMYEWMQEAIAKGIQDVHEIQRYVKQKEISLYGA